MKWVIRIVGGLVALLVLSVLGLWIASHRRDAGRMRVSIEIARSPEEIWDWLSEPDKLTQWVGWLSAVQSDSTSAGEGIGHHAAWIMDDPRMKQKFTLPGTITVWDPPLQMGVHIAAPTAPGAPEGDVLYKLTDLGNGRTRLEQDGRFRYLDKFAALIEPMATPEAMRKMFDDMNRLKLKVEAVPFEADSTGELDAGRASAEDAPADSAASEH